jgi:hypothetical protein
MLFYIGCLILSLFIIFCIAGIIDQYYISPKKIEDKKKLDNSENSDKHQAKEVYNSFNPRLQELIESFEKAEPLIKSPLNTPESDIHQVQELLNHAEEGKPLSDKQELYTAVMKDFDEKWYKTTGERSYIDSIINNSQPSNGSWREEEMEMTSSMLDTVGKIQDGLTKQSNRTV